MLDDFERKILVFLQQQARASMQEVSEAVGLSPSPCWRRIKRLEDEGFIERYAAVLEPKRLGLKAFAYVQVSLLDHREATIDLFETFIASNPQVLECATITGEYDYMLKVTAEDPEALEDFIMKGLLRLEVVRSTSTNFALRQLKSFGPLPIASD